MAPADAIPRNFRELLAFLRAAYARFDEDRCLQVAGSLTYTSILSIVPLVTVALAVMSAFPVFGRWSKRIDGFMVADLLPHAIGNAVTSSIAQFSEQAGRLTALGIAVLAATALMLMLTIEGAFNQMFRVSRERPIVQRLLVYWLVLTLGPILFGASLSMTSYLVSTSLGLAKGLPILGEAMLRALPVLLAGTALTLLYLIVPNRRVRVRHALIGGLIAGILFELTKRAFALYIANFPTYTLVYGAFAVIPIFLVWMYLSWVVVLIGASLTALLPGYRHAEPRRSPPGRRYLSALEILGKLVAAQHSGRALPLAPLAEEVRLAPESCERLLERMAELGWVVRTTGDGWMLARDPGELSAADVHRNFVFDPDAFGDLPERVHAQPVAAAHRDLLRGPLNLPLKNLLGSSGAPR